MSNFLLAIAILVFIIVFNSNAVIEKILGRFSTPGSQKFRCSKIIYQFFFWLIPFTGFLFVNNDDYNRNAWILVGIVWVMFAIISCINMWYIHKDNSEPSTKFNIIIGIIVVIAIILLPFIIY